MLMHHILFHFKQASNRSNKFNKRIKRKVVELLWNVTKLQSTKSYSYRCPRIVRMVFVYELIYNC